MNAVIAPSQCPITRDSMRILGEKSANDFLACLDGCADPSGALVEWRAHCHAELLEECEGRADCADLLTLWGRAFDSVQPSGLAPKEMELLRAYRLADDRGRESILCSARGQAEDWPRYTFATPHEASGGAA